MLSLRWVADPETLPEGAAGCHAPQSSDPADRHYHHVAGCGYEAGSAADTLEALLQAPAAAGPQGATLTAFVKFMIAREGDAWCAEA